MVAIVADANDGSARLLADAEVREERLAVKLLAMEGIESEFAQKGKWEIKQWEDLGVMMRSRRKKIKVIKQVVDAVGEQVAAIAIVPPAVEAPAAPPGVTASE